MKVRSSFSYTGQACERVFRVFAITTGSNCATTKNLHIHFSQSDKSLLPCADRQSTDLEHDSANNLYHSHFRRTVRQLSHPTSRFDIVPRHATRMSWPHWYDVRHLWHLLGECWILEASEAQRLTREPSRISRLPSSSSSTTRQPFRYTARHT